MRLAELIERDADTFASLEAIDAGVVFDESKRQAVPQAAETLRFFAAEATVAAGKMLRIPEGYAYTQREPFVVAAAIVPWNAPLYETP